jgi:hypothetical protein
MQKVIDLVAQVRRLKTERQLSLKTPLQALTVYTPDQALLEALQQQAPLIRGVTQAVVVQFQIGNKISTLEHTGDELQATVGMEK